MATGHVSMQHRTMMAGHNKWSKIRHKKGANDVKKALILGKASKSLTVASKECQGDRSDMRLQAAIQHAKSVQLPRDRIDEAIEKGTKPKSGGEDDFFPLRFDAMMKLEGNRDPGDSSDSSVPSVQVACIITALSDNRNRTTQHVRHLVTKFGGEFLPTDHLNYLFDHVGHILVEIAVNKIVDTNSDVEEAMLILEEELMECALEAGAINIEPSTDDGEEDDTEIDGPTAATEATARFVVTTEEKELWKVVRALRGEATKDTIEDDNGDSTARWNLLRFEHRYVLKDQDYGEVAGVHSESPARDSLDTFLEQLDENEDVHKVYHNAALLQLS